MTLTEQDTPLHVLFPVRAELFLKTLNELKENHRKRKFPTLPPDSFAFVELSDKWLKVVQTKSNGSQSVYCFIARKDYSNKGLGQVKMGDIHKPAGWKAPAKTARGSIFSDNFTDCLGPYGVAYLRDNCSPSFAELEAK